MRFSIVRSSVVTDHFTGRVLLLKVFTNSNFWHSSDVQPQFVMNQPINNDVFYFLERGEHLLISNGEQRLVYNVYRKLKDERYPKPLKRTSELVGYGLKLVREILKKEKVNRKSRKKTNRTLENRCLSSKVIGCKLD